MVRTLCLLAFVFFLAACKESKTGGTGGKTEPPADSSRYSYKSHLAVGNYSFDVFTEGLGSLRSMTVVFASDGAVDTIREEIDGAVVSAFAGDLDGDAYPEVCVTAQSAGSGSYVSLYGYQRDNDGIHKFTLPELDKRLSAGYMGHDTLWTQDSVLVRSFPVYTEGDFNATASGGTRILEYVLRRNEAGQYELRVSRIKNQAPQSTQ